VGQDIAQAIRAPSPTVAAAIIVAACAAAFAVFSRLPISHDVAWLLDATGRWLRGAALYVDIVELNPPLIFYETAALSFGTGGKAAFLAGFCLAVAVSALWCLRLAGGWTALAALAAMLLAGFGDFGQRDHLALVFVLPGLIARAPGRREGVLLGLWAFLGVGLKPWFLLIPLLASLGEAVAKRSWRPVLSPANWALGLACLAYVLLAWSRHPAYFTDTVPLARLVYSAFGAEPLALLARPGLAAAAGVLALGLVRPDPVGLRYAGALAGGLASYLLQGKGWSYQMIPATGLAVLLGVHLLRTSPPPRRLAAAGLAGLALLLAVSAGPYRPLPIVIPAGARSVLFLSTNVSVAYPATLEAGARHESRYPTLWPLPGAWSIVHDPAASPERRARAARVLEQTRAAIVDDILAGRPELIFVDERADKPYFDRPFDHHAFIAADPRFTGYSDAGRQGVFRVLRRDSAKATPAKKSRQA
jgi:hypothetical protein